MLTVCSWRERETQQMIMSTALNIRYIHESNTLTDIRKTKLHLSFVLETFKMNKSIKLHTHTHTHTDWHSFKVKKARQLTLDSCTHTQPDTAIDKKHTHIHERMSGKRYTSIYCILYIYDVWERWRECERERERDRDLNRPGILKSCLYCRELLRYLVYMARTITMVTKRARWSEIENERQVEGARLIFKCLFSHNLSSSRVYCILRGVSDIWLILI